MPRTSSAVIDLTQDDSSNDSVPAATKASPQLSTPQKRPWSSASSHGKTSAGRRSETMFKTPPSGTGSFTSSKNASVEERKARRGIIYLEEVENSGLEDQAPTINEGETRQSEHVTPDSRKKRATSVDARDDRKIINKPQRTRKVALPDSPSEREHHQQLGHDSTSRPPRTQMARKSAPWHTWYIPQTASSIQSSRPAGTSPSVVRPRPTLVKSSAPVIPRAYHLSAPSDNDKPKSSSSTNAGQAFEQELNAQHSRAYVSDSESGSDVVSSRSRYAHERRRQASRNSDFEAQDSEPQDFPPMENVDVAAGRRRRLVRAGLRKSPQPQLVTEPQQAYSKAEIEITPLHIDDISVEKVEAVLAKHLEEYEHDHTIQTRKWLARARHQNMYCMAEAVSKNPRLRVSPFAQMQPIEVSSGVHKKKGPLDENFHQWFGAATSVQKEYRVPMNAVSSASHGPRLPPFVNHRKLGHNIVDENVKDLKALPFFAEDSPFQPDDPDEYEAHLAQEYPLAGLSRRWNTARFQERCQLLEPYIHRFLDELGCSMDDVLRYFLSHIQETFVGDIPAALLHDWKEGKEASGFNLAEGLARIERKNKSNETTAGDHVAERKLRRWAYVLSSLPKVKLENIIIAGFASVAFLNKCSFHDHYKGQDCRFSLWHLAQSASFKRAFPDQQSQPDAIPTDPLAIYQDLACAVCQLHNCPLHGEFEDMDYTNEDDRNQTYEDLLKSTGNFDSDWTNQKIRIRMPTRISQLNEASLFYLPTPKSRDETSYLGRDAKRGVTGLANTQALSGSLTTYSDSQSCSKSCFWFKENRVSFRSIQDSWSASEIAEVRSLMNAYGSSKRGPCHIALVFRGRHSCAEVFAIMLHIAGGLTIASTHQAKVNDLTTVKKHGPIDFLRDDRFANTARIESRAIFYPCDHTGSCEDAKCSCYVNRIACEKTCGCSMDCHRRFPGCRCARSGKICFKNNDCLCFALNRECDPDLCSTCGADTILDPANRFDESVLQGNCRNCSLQHGVWKRLLLGRSQVAGFGVFAGEAIRKNDLIAEYSAEVISKSESERRDITYQHRETTYLFDINEDQVLDGMYAGNKTRFINHSSRNQNVFPRPMLCNTVARMGMYARRHIQPGEELFFDYGPKFTNQKPLVELEIANGDQGLSKVKASKSLKPQPPVGKARKPATTGVLKTPRLQKADLEESSTDVHMQDDSDSSSSSDQAANIDEVTATLAEPVRLPSASDDEDYIDEGAALEDEDERHVKEQARRRGKRKRGRSYG